MAIPPLQPAIEDDAPARKGLDYAALRSEGIDLAQLYSGAIWTDYNEHDPGVTILEALCYALTELSYRADFPVTDILADRDGGLQSIASVLHRPSRILPAEPVTLLDYRRLLIDRVDGLANVWLAPRSAGSASPATGLYDIFYYAAPNVPGIFERARPSHRVAARTARAFIRHRALCEDIGGIEALEPARIVVRATVAIERSASPERVMADLIQRLACYLAPEPRRRPLRALVDEGRSLAEIFEGPLLINGFIDPSDLTEPRQRVAGAELSHEIENVPGVLGVREIDLWAHPDWRDQVALGPNQYFSLDAGLDASVLPIRLIADGHERPVDPGTVRRLLDRSWRAHRRTYRLGTDCRALFPPPAGRARPIGNYTPVASQFPAVYGVGPRGLPPNAKPERIAQARQLEAYLALFDRLMADYLDRLANICPLLAATPLDASAFSRPLAQIAPWMSNLLVDDGRGIEGQSGRDAFTIGQQSRLADFLLALYGEDPDPLIPHMPDRFGGRDEGQRRLDIKRALLHRLIAAGKGRGRGLDYRQRRPRRDRPGVELRSRIMLGTETHGGGRDRPRLAVVEHVLLRPRRPDVGCAEDAPAGDAMTVTAIVHLPGEPAGRAPRRQVEKMIRANTPAHIHLRTFFVEREHWVRFRRLHRLWRQALREDIPEAIDCVSAEMHRRFDRWAEEAEA